MTTSNYASASIAPSIHPTNANTMNTDALSQNSSTDIVVADDISVNIISPELDDESNPSPILTQPSQPLTLAERFRKFMPVVVDVETAGFNAQTDALLEIACIPILMDENGRLYQGEPLNAHIEPFIGANLEARALAFTGIEPNNPLRKAIAEDEKIALRRIFKVLKELRKEHGCRQCVLVGHNAHFDLNFLNAAIERTNSKNHSPFHKFSVFDTVSLAALAYGQTVLARACKASGIEFSGEEAHSALYDTIKTAELFCQILNGYSMLPSTTEPTQNQATSDN